VACEAHLSSGAEDAAHATAGLRGYARCVPPILVRHEDGLDELTIWQSVCALHSAVFGDLKAEFTRMRQRGEKDSEITGFNDGKRVNLRKRDGLRSSIVWCILMNTCESSLRDHLFNNDIEGAEAKVRLQQVPKRPRYVRHVFKASYALAYPPFNLMPSRQTVQNTSNIIKALN